MPTPNPLTLSIIGEGKLLTQCANLILDAGHSLAAIYSSDQAVQRWGQQRSLPMGRIDGPDPRTLAYPTTRIDGLLILGTVPSEWADWVAGLTDERSTGEDSLGERSTGENSTGESFIGNNSTGPALTGWILQVQEGPCLQPLNPASPDSPASLVGIAAIAQAIRQGDSVLPMTWSLRITPPSETEWRSPTPVPNLNPAPHQAQRWIPIKPQDTLLSLQSRAAQSVIQDLAHWLKTGALAQLSGSIPTPPPSFFQDPLALPGFGLTDLAPTVSGLPPSAVEPAPLAEPALGLLDWQQPAIVLDRQVRSLSAAPRQVNPRRLSLPWAKLALGTVPTLWLVGQLNPVSSPLGSPSLPGTILQVDSAGLQVSTSTQPVYLSQLRSLRGEVINPAIALAALGLGVGDRLPGLAEAAESLPLLHQIQIQEGHWGDRLLDLEPLSLPLETVINHTPVTDQASAWGESSIPDQRAYDCQIPPDLQAAITAYLATQPFTPQEITLSDVLQAAWLVFVGRLGGSDRFDLAWQGPSLHRVLHGEVLHGEVLHGEVLHGEVLHGEVLHDDAIHGSTGKEDSVIQAPLAVGINPWIPWRVDLPMDQSFSTWVQQVYHQRTQLDSPLGYSVDLPLRLAQYEQCSIEAMVELPLGMVCCDRLPQDSQGFNLGEQIALVITPTGQLRWLQATTSHGLAMERLHQRWLQVVHRLVTDPEQPLRQVSLLFPEEEPQVLGHVPSPSPNLSQPGDSQPSIQQRFEAQVLATPDAIAVQDGDRQISYADLNAQANRLARHLRALGVGPERFVGIFMERSLDVIVAMWAVLKAGGAYIPLDPAYPQERLTFMLEDAQPLVVITQASLAPRLPAPSGNPSPLQSPLGLVWEAIAPTLANYEATDLGELAELQHLAYLIYTSGSTGLPKGVLIERRSLGNFVQGAIQTYGLRASDRVLQFASLSFDAAVEEIYGSLCCGATLILRTDAMMGSVPQFVQQCQRLGITVLDLTTAYWHLLVAEWETDPQLALPETIRLVIIGGEAINPQRVETWIRLTGDRIPLFNTYGPTEATVVALAKQVTPTHSPNSDAIQSASGVNPSPHTSIGFPLPNYQTYILDRWQQPVPPGWPGELHIGGPSVGRGYLNRPERTAQTFWESPFPPLTLFPSEPQPERTRLYRTGDLTRALPNGEIEFLGRIDRQVKIRGFRIEPMEIEAAMSQHPLIQTAIVEVYQPTPGNLRLAAYVVPQAGVALPKGILREFLQSRLPDYMIPSVFVTLDSLPLTPNGKIDRRSLPDPNHSSVDALDGGFIPPRPGLEHELAQIWESVLGIATVGRHDHFFEIGGDSLSAIRLFVQIERHFGQSLQLSTLFQAPTLAQLAEVLAGNGSTLPPTSLVPIKVSGHHPPLFFVNSISYARALGPYLSPDYPLYGLNIFGITRELIERVADLTLPELAAIFIRDLRSRQPQGPYFLTGYCDDAKVALEMARQLRKQGETIGLLCLVDPIWEEVQAPRISWSSMTQFGPGYVVEKVCHRLRFTRYSLTLRLQRLWSRLRFSPTKISPELAQDLEILKRYEALCATFAPPTYAGDIIVFASEEIPIVKAPMLMNAVGGYLRVETLPGYHHTLFQEPWIQHLAERLQQEIDRTLVSKSAEAIAPR